MTQKVDKTNMQDVEIGVERLSHALRWKLHLERTGDAEAERAPSQNESVQNPERNGQQTTGMLRRTDDAQTQPRLSQDTDQRQQRTLATPCFPNIPTKQADLVDRDTEHAMGVLKHKIMATYRNAPRTAPNTTGGTSRDT